MVMLLSAKNHKMLQIIRFFKDKQYLNYKNNLEQGTCKADIKKNVVKGKK